FMFDIILIFLSRLLLFFFSSRRRHTRSKRDWSSDVCSSDLLVEKYQVDMVAIGNGTASRESEQFVASQLQKISQEVYYAMVNERSEERRVGKECRCRWSTYH